ncbi:MAG: mechanosensitive ion channel family protein [Elusimicrobia bacterium]|nr:mechanosensitive ion channel family protein [Elusimicrobiota bacterium]
MIRGILSVLVAVSLAFQASLASAAQQFGSRLNHRQGPRVISTRPFRGAPRIFEGLRRQPGNLPGPAGRQPLALEGETPILESASGRLSAGAQEAQLSLNPEEDPHRSKARLDHAWSEQDFETAESQRAVAGREGASGQSLGRPSGVSRARPRSAVFYSVAPLVLVAAQLEPSLAPTLQSVWTWAASFYQRYQAFLHPVFLIGGTFGGHRLLHWAITKWAMQAGWDAKKTRKVRGWATTLLLATVAFLGLQINNQALAFLAGAGLGTMAAFVAAEDLVGNPAEGFKFVLNRPILIGDYIIIDGKTYQFAGFDNLREYRLDLFEQSYAKKPYLTLQQAPVFVARPFELEPPVVELPKVNFLKSFWSAVGFATRPSNVDLGRIFRWLGLSVVVFYGLPWLQGLVDWAPLQRAFPWMQFASLLSVTYFFDQWLRGLIERFAQAKGWLEKPRHRQIVQYVKFFTQFLVYVGGAYFGLFYTGTAPNRLRMGEGAIGAAAVVATNKTIKAIVQWWWNRYNDDLAPGKIIQVGKASGEILEVNAQYVALAPLVPTVKDKHGRLHKGHWRVPIAMLGDGFDRIDERESGKLPPPPSLPVEIEAVLDFSNIPAQ